MNAVRSIAALTLAVCFAGCTSSYTAIAGTKMQQERHGRHDLKRTLGSLKTTAQPESMKPNEAKAMRGGLKRVTTKTVSWKTLSSGDCRQENATLVLRSDGTAHFSSIVWTRSTHSGDYWWTSFEFQDKDKVRILAISWRKGPRMDDGNPSPRYHFDFDFTFDKAQYDRIGYVYNGYKC